MTTYRAGVVVDLEVRLILDVLDNLRFAERCRLAKMVLIQLGKEGLVGSLREHALLLQDGQDTHRLNTHCNRFASESLHKAQSGTRE